MCSRQTILEDGTAHRIDTLKAALAGRHSRPSSEPSYRPEGTKASSFTYDQDGKERAVAEINFLSLTDYVGPKQKTGWGVAALSSGKKTMYTLMNVPQMLNSNQSFVPYRQSKVTRILQDSLFKTSGAVVIACLEEVRAVQKSKACVRTIQKSKACSAVEHQSSVQNSPLDPVYLPTTTTHMALLPGYAMQFGSMVVQSEACVVMDRGRGHAVRRMGCVQCGAWVCVQCSTMAMEHRTTNTTSPPLCRWPNSEEPPLQCGSSCSCIGQKGEEKPGSMPLCRLQCSSSRVCVQCRGGHVLAVESVCACSAPVLVHLFIFLYNREKNKHIRSLFTFHYTSSHLHHWCLE